MHRRLMKTSLGQQAFKERSPALAGKLRSAFLMFDGQRTVSEVLHATQGLGVALADVQELLDARLLEPVSAADAGACAPPVAGVPVPPAPSAAPSSERTPQERYRDAYPLAVGLTGKLGLTGFRLNLAVEGCTSYDTLAALAPRIQTAVSAREYAPLHQALFD